MNILGENDRPLTPETLSFNNVLEDTSIESQITVIDDDVNDTHTFKVINQGAGTVTFDPEEKGRFVYELAPDFADQDRFTVRVTDSSGDAASFSDTEIIINVAQVNDPPTSAETVTLPTNEDNAVSGSLLLEDVDNIYGDSQTFEATPNSGDIEFNADGTFTYRPDENSNGTDSFTVVITDSAFVSTETLVTIEVAPINDAPKLIEILDDLTVEEGHFVNGDLQLDDPDLFDDLDPLAERDSHTFVLNSDPALGSIEFNRDGNNSFDGTFVYTANDNVIGIDTFGVTVTDSKGEQFVSQVTIEVIPDQNDPNDPPTDILPNNTVFNVDETAELDTEIDQLSVIDPDLNDTHTYNLVTNPNNLFRIDSEEGIIFTNQNDLRAYRDTIQLVFYHL